ncbi:hypothetical protein ACIF83_27090 [Streptomyces sp. NPDC085866]|uniref:hypothetical protein n=1 Tax=Streptomyces sp. NPDC085866 TaxID=3365736 RepID=UPI0037D23E8B
MADEHNKWLTRDLAERLLRGESLEAVDASSSDQAERLAKALGALSAEAAPATGELPGEQGALAAFRKAREAAEAERTAAALGDGTPAGRSRPPASVSDAGLVRIGAPTRTGTRARRPRWARPVRLALAAAVAAGTLGGVAMAAGSGVLPIPFHDDHPNPTSSVSAAQSPGQPHTSPTPQSPEGIRPSTDTPEGGTSGSLDPSGGATQQGTHPGVTPGSGDASGTPGTWWQVARAACRDLRDGRELGSDRRRVLEGLAGGSSRVATYCKSVLAGQYSSGGTGKGTGDDEGGKGRGGDGDGKDKGDGNGQGGDDDGHPGRGHGHRHDRRGRAVSPAPSALVPLGPDRKAAGPVPSPSPSYTAL